MEASDNQYPVDQDTPEEPIEETSSTKTTTKKENLKNDESSKDIDLKKDDCNECSFWDKYKWVIIVILLLIVGYFIYIYFFQDNNYFKSSSEFGSVSIKPSEPFFDPKPNVATNGASKKIGTI